MILVSFKSYIQVLHKSSKYYIQLLKLYLYIYIHTHIYTHYNKVIYWKLEITMKTAEDNSKMLNSIIEFNCIRNKLQVYILQNDTNSLIKKSSGSYDTLLIFTVT